MFGKSCAVTSTHFKSSEKSLPGFLGGLIYLLKCGHRSESVFASRLGDKTWLVALEVRVMIKVAAVQRLACPPQVCLK